MSQPDPPYGTIVSPLLVGRALEIEQIEAALGAAQAGQGSLLFIAGEAGVGKSRLLREARQRAARAGWAVAQGHCFEQDATFPYAAWIDLLRASLAQPGPEPAAERLGPQAPELLKLLPELAHSLPGLTPSAHLDAEAEKRRLFEALAQFLRQLAAGGPALITLEDLHWSDEASLDFLHFLARRLAEAPLLVVASYRREEVSASLAHLLAQLNRERRAQEIMLRPLSRDEVATLVQAIFNIERPIRSDFVDRIMPLSEGNPYVVEEILKTLVEEGDIFYADGRWERKSANELHIPRSVRDAVEQRLARLNPPARELVMIAAVAGYRFDFELLQAVMRLSESELMQQIKELIGAQLVAEEALDRFAFRHALTREAIYASPGRWLARERQAWHRTIAEALERRQARPGEAPLPDLARHFYLGGVWDKALDYSRRAGEQALALYAPREALEHFSRALDAAQRLARAPSVDLLRARASAYQMLDDFDAACADLESALAGAVSSGDLHGEWQATLDLGFLWAARDFAQSGELFQRALEAARGLGDASLVAHTLNRVGNWQMSRDEPFEAQRYHDEALQIFRQSNDPRGLAETLELLGVTSHAQGNPLRGEAYCREALAVFRQLGDRQGQVHALAHLVTPAQFDTEVGAPADILQRMTHAEAALQIAREMSWRYGEGFVLTTLGECLAAAGDYARALEVVSAGAAIGEEINHRLVMIIAQWITGQVYRDLLDLPAARGHLEAGLATARDSHSVMFTRILTTELASTRMQQNELAEAQALLESMLIGPATGSRHLRMGWAARAELALAQGEPALALRLSDDLLASAPNLEQTGARGIPRLARLRGEALAALGRTAEATEALEAARDGAREQGRKPLLWRVQVSLSKLYQAAGRAAQAEQQRAAARELIEALAAPLGDATLREGFRQRARALVPDPPAVAARPAARKTFDGLTAREREVAILVAQGKSNSEIAQALVTSRRTVEKHVGNILDKLGFTSRTQVVAWAFETGLTRPGAGP